jgi:hypothetical protein
MRKQQVGQQVIHIMKELKIEEITFRRGGGIDFRKSLLSMKRSVLSLLLLAMSVLAGHAQAPDEFVTSSDGTLIAVHESGPSQGRPITARLGQRLRQFGYYGDCLGGTGKDAVKTES